MKSFFILFYSLFLFACTSINKKNNPQFSNISPEIKKKFQDSIRLMERGRYKNAIQGFRAVTEKHPRGLLNWSARFNIASSYQKMKNCKKSKEIFSLLTDDIEDSAFKTQALLQLHYSYECLGNLEMSLLVLKDVEKKDRNLDESSRLVEIPARFSILYAQMQNEKKSLFYANKAFEGIELVKAPIKDTAIAEKTASKLFYFMGRSLVKGSVLNLEHYLPAFPHHQIYLVQSYLLNDPLWSPQAEKELKHLYDKLWSAYKKTSEKKKPIYKHKVIQNITKFQTLVRDSSSPSLNKLSASIIKKAARQFQLNAFK